VGRDEAGKEILAKFKKEKINTNFVQLDNNNLTGFSFILALDKKEREHVAFAYRGANEAFNFNPKKLSRLRCQWLYLTSLSGKSWLKNLKPIFSFAAKKHVKIAWNPGSLQLQAGRRVLSSFLKQTQLLILNKDEAIELVLSGIKLGRKDPNHLNRPLYLLNILREWGPKIVVITEGKKGAWAYDGKKIHRGKIRKAKVLDTTGVGDSFGSAFLAGLIKDKGDIAQALKWGMVNSGSAVTKVGAQNGLLTYEELKKKL
jgi:sugar/nucleoside kinase (ribokinase family)